MKTVFIFIPDNLQRNHVGVLEGFSKNIHHNLTFYITNEKVLNNSSKSVGFCSDRTPDNLHVKQFKHCGEWLHINTITRKITIHGLKNDILADNYKIVCIKYSYKAFRQSDIVKFKSQDYGEHFETLAYAIKYKKYENCIHRQKKRNILQAFSMFVLNVFLLVIILLLKFCTKISPYVSCSATISHFQNSVATVKWVLTSVREERRITLRVGNALVSKIVDIVLGVLFLYFFLQYEEQFITLVQDFAEKIIQGLNELLTFLMGSPVGLKLNYAFNRTLGTFFMYNISLWRTFLKTTSPLLGIAFRLLRIPGALGLTFQAALFSDLVAFSTFHVYCIYVYAARLYGLQIRSLISLWRLFIGRKYNPLRERVDSYQYTHHQLFIGTLGFTILLFLLPTTFLYYAVFITFRLGLIFLDGILLRLRYVLQCFPLYICILWVFNSSSITGDITMQLIADNEEAPLTVQATLQKLSLWNSIVQTVPKSFEILPSVSLSTVFHDSFIGILL